MARERTLKSSTFARLLKEGDRFYERGGDYKLYTVERVEIPHETMIHVFVEGRSKPFVFNDTDRVELR